MRMKISGLTGGWPTFSKVGEPMTSRTGEPPRIIASPTSEDMGHPAEDSAWMANTCRPRLCHN